MTTLSISEAQQKSSASAVQSAVFIALADAYRGFVALTRNGMVALGAPVGSALYTCTLWLTLVLVASLSLADSYRGRAPGLKLVLSLSALAGVESRQQGWSIPLALMLVAWHWRGRTA